MVSKTLFATFMLVVLCAVLVESMPSAEEDAAKDETAKFASEAENAAQEGKKKGTEMAGKAKDGMEKAGAMGKEMVGKGKTAEEMGEKVGAGMLHKAKDATGAFEKKAEDVVDTLGDFWKSSAKKGLEFIF